MKYFFLLYKTFAEERKRETEKKESCIFYVTKKANEK